MKLKKLGSTALYVSPIGLGMATLGRPGYITVGSKWGYRYTADWNIEAEHHEIKQKEGVCMGLSLSGARQWETLEKARRISFDGVALFDTVQVTYNVLETSAEKALKEASGAGMELGLGRNSCHNSCMLILLMGFDQQNEVPPLRPRLHGSFPKPLR